MVLYIINHVNNFATKKHVVFGTFQLGYTFTFKTELGLHCNTEYFLTFIFIIFFFTNILYEPLL